MHVPAQSDRVVVINMMVARPPQGTVWYGASSSPFHGWLELMAVIERLVGAELPEPAQDFARQLDP